MNIDRSSLPPNVRRWLDHALPSDIPANNKISNSQEGEMDVRGRWTSFTATTTYESQPFSFRWQARLKVMPVVWVSAEDWHDATSGGGSARMWGFIPMGGRQDGEAFLMQVVRNLAELPWKPAFTLSMPELTWQDTGDSAFEVSLEVSNQVARVNFQMNEQDEVIQASSRRHYDVPDGYVEVPWQIAYADYQPFDGVLLPTRAEAAYHLENGSWTYWRGQITSVNNRKK
jgi:hypothetical protein